MTAAMQYFWKHMHRLKKKAKTVKEKNTWCNGVL